MQPHRRSIRLSSAPSSFAAAPFAAILCAAALSAATLCAATLCAACAAAPNPKISKDPAPWRPPAPATAGGTSATNVDASKNAEGTSGGGTGSSRDGASTSAPNGGVASTASGSGASPAASTGNASEPKSANGDAYAGPVAPKGAQGEPIVAKVGGEPIYVSELLSQWLYLDSFRVLDQLRNLAMGRLVLAEAQRLRVTIAPDVASKAYENAVKAMEAEIQRSDIGKKTPNLTLDKYVDRVLGLDSIRYREKLRDDALRACLGERVARAWLLTQEHAEIHVIVVSSEDDIKAAQKDLADGVSFEEVARKRSKDTSAREGGWITPIVKGDTPLGKLAFTTPIGAVAGPVTDSGAWLLVRVDARPDPLVGDWSKIGPAVEASLEKRLVDPLEVKQWNSAMLDRYEVDLKPFLDLVHEPQR